MSGPSHAEIERDQDTASDILVLHWACGRRVEHLIDGATGGPARFPQDEYGRDALLRAVEVACQP